MVHRHTLHMTQSLPSKQKESQAPAPCLYHFISQLSELLLPQNPQLGDTCHQHCSEIWRVQRSSCSPKPFPRAGEAPNIFLARFGKLRYFAGTGAELWPCVHQSRDCKGDSFVWKCLSKYPGIWGEMGEFRFLLGSVERSLSAALEFILMTIWVAFISCS